MNFGWPEILILLVIVVLLFGVGRIGKIATEMGQGLRNFRKAMDGEKDETDKKPSDKKAE
ncbi:MAG: twin-arginine translocase TatA/TatE family subunit [Anaerolineaceae bacterium]